MTRILLTNDDGIDAPGLVAIRRELENRPGIELWVVAPNGERSACSHGMTLGTPISVKKISERCFAHSGVVADGVYFAIVHLLPSRPDIVISGINKGANLAEDVIYSGTVAGAREAVLRGVTGLSISLISGDDFSYAAPNAANVAIALAGKKNNAAALLNLNYPPGEFEGPIIAPLGKRPYEPRVVEQVIPETGEIGYVIGGPPVKDAVPPTGSDVALINDGKAAITPLLINQTDVTAVAQNEFSFLCGTAKGRDK